MNYIFGLWGRFCSLRRIGAKYLARFIHTLLQKKKKHKKKALSLGSVSALERWSGSRIKQRGSIPKLLVMDNALISAMTDQKFGQAIEGIKYIPIEKFFNEPGKSIGL